MLILIAESKTMLGRQQPVTPDQFAAHTPCGYQQAAEIIARLSRLSQSELIAETGFSPSLAASFRQMIYEFPNTLAGLPAIEAFTGVVFKALDYPTLPEEARNRCDSDVRVISSLYGLLRPADIVKPYRLDFTTKVAPDGHPLNTFWKKDVTIELVKTIRDSGHTQLLNLLPADAAKAVDWKIVKRFCKVWKADFVEVTDGGTPRTPPAGKLKTMRGKLLRQTLLQHAADIADIKTIATDDLLCEGTPVNPDHLQFLC